MANKLVKWNTGRKINAFLPQIEFLSGYRPIHQEVYDIYKHLKSYSIANYNDVPSRYGFDQGGFDEWIVYLDNVTQFQKFVRDNENSAEDDISKMAVQLFGNSNIVGAVGMEILEIDRLLMLVEYAENIRHLFNYLLPLTEPHSSPMSVETEAFVKEIIDLIRKGKVTLQELVLLISITKTVSV